MDQGAKDNAREESAVDAIPIKAYRSFGQRLLSPFSKTSLRIGWDGIPYVGEDHWHWSPRTKTINPDDNHDLVTWTGEKTNDPRMRGRHHYGMGLLAMVTRFTDCDPEP